MFSTVQDFLLGLTPSRAFALFIGCLAISTALIFAEWGKPLSPSLPVIAYGAVLFYCQKWLFVQLNATAKDSPYFLGFLLTLIALLQVLSLNLSGPINEEFMVREVGAAILTTVCGLFMRQALLSRDPSEEAQDRVFQGLSDEIRKDTLEFHRTQKLFVDLVKEFVQTREEMFTREEKAFSQYVEGLQEGATLLGKIQRQYPKRIESLLNSIEASAAKINEVSDQQAILFATLAKSSADEFERGRKSIAVARDEFDKHFSELRAGLGDAMKMLSEHSRGLGGFAASYTQINEGLTKSVSELSGAISVVSEGATNVTDDIRRIATDLKAIDTIVDDLVRILRVRMTALSARP